MVRVLYAVPTQGIPALLIREHEAGSDPFGEMKLNVTDGGLRWGR